MDKETIISEIQKYIIEGNKKTDIIERIKTEYKGDIPSLYQEAIERFSLVPIENKDIKLGFCQTSLLNLYQKMYECGDYAGALNAMKELSKLSNLYEYAKTLGNKSYEVAKKKEDSLKNITIDITELKK